MSRGAMLRTVAAAAAIAAAAPARAQPYDPAFRWRTVETPHFRIHYHQGEEELVQDVAREAEAAHARLVPLLGYAPPRRTEVVLSDDVDDANGSATPLPYNIVRLYAVPPSSLSVLQDYRDWIHELVQHEYTHILHLDNVGGIPAGVNGIFGKVWVPNGFIPTFFIEGLAVVNESGGDPMSGRNASALFDMYARTLALDGPFPRLDEASNPYLDWPVGNVPYLLGGRFMGFLQARYGAASIAGFSADQGARVWPYAPSSTGERWFGGKGFPELWAEYERAERAYAEGKRAAIGARAVTLPVRLTRRGGQVQRPRFSPDGTFIVYAGRSLDDAPGVFRVALDGRDLGRVTIVDANGTLALRTPREAIVAIGEVYREFRVYDDLYLVDLETGSRRRLTHGERATDPDVSPGGRTVVYARHTGGGGMALIRRSLDGGEPEVLFAHRSAQVYMPRIARDGRVAFELHADGRRDIALWHDGRVDRITDDEALDTGPAWTPDGRFLLFASDRGGVFNLYAWESATGAVRQVTNVEAGAFEPDVSPDGKTIALLTYSRAGWDVATIPFDEATWLDPTPAPPVQWTEPSTSAATLTTTSTATPTATTTATPTATSTATATAADPPEYPSHPYSPWSTLRPTFWLPFVATDGAGPVYGAFTAGADVLLQHIYTLQGWWSGKGHEPGYAAFYQGAWSWPRLDVSSRLSLDESPGPPDRLQRVWTYADSGLTFTSTRLARQLALRIGWSGTRYESVGAMPPLPGSLEPIRFQDGFLSDASVELRYTDSRRFVHSISPETGRTASLRLRFAGPEIGSDYALKRAQSAVAQYFRVPATRHTVLALRLGGGLADGTIGGNAPFELGGFGSVDPVNLLTGGATVGSDQLRGYPSGAFGGTGYVLGNLELRFPIANPAAGRTTWPIFLRRVHGALFADLGETFDRPGELALAGHRLAADELRLSAGAELRLEVALGYHLLTDVRIGVARPFGAVFGRGRAADLDEGVRLSEVVFFLTIGPSF